MIHHADDQMLDIAVEIFTKAGQDVPKPVYTNEFGTSLTAEEVAKLIYHKNPKNEALFTIIRQA